ncbi:E3 ubiquitin-protein ligase bre1 [Mortierella sp. GBA30]|nr:E3 ubiquitin-protein ligase bre1 [Mortierella sp. GBA30]
MDDRGTRKRTHTDEVGSPIQVPASNVNGNPAPFTPPANKRQFTGSRSSSPSTASKEDAETMTAAEEVLLNFQKEAIWRQTQEYKRETARAVERISQLEVKQADYDAHLSAVDEYWDKLLSDLLSLVSRTEIAKDHASAILDDGTSFASLLKYRSGPDAGDEDIKELTGGSIKEAVEVRSNRTKEVALKLLKIIDHWTEQRDGFWTSLTAAGSTAVQQLTATHENLLKQYKKGQVDIDCLQAKCHEFSDQVLRLKNELEITKIRLFDTAEDMNECKERLRRIEHHTESEKIALEATLSENNTTVAGSAMPTLAMLNDMSEASREELLQHRRLAISRLAEVEEMKMQKAQLQEDVDKVRLQLNYLSDEKIQDSQYVRALLVQMQSVRHDADFYRGEVLKLRADLEDLHVSRRKFVDTLENEEKNRRATLEAELKKLESDISRVRDSRDRFQQMYENRCTKDDYEVQQNQEIRKIANTRKDRITALTTDIQRLQAMLATDSDDWDTYAFYYKKSDDKAMSQDLRSKLSVAEEQIQSLTMELEASKETALQLRDLATVSASETQLKEQAATLSAKLTDLDGLIGSGADDNIKALVATIEAKETAIKRLELKVQAHEAVQAPLLNELHTVATAWGQLEEATSRKAIDLAQKEDLIFKLLSDKTRQESKCSHLVRAKEQSANMTAVMKRQSDMQLDQIRRLEEREKTLSEQMATLEKEQTTLNGEVVLHKTKLQEFTQHSSSYKEKFSKQEDRLSELQVLLKERTDAYESEALAKKRLLEESETMKRKLEEQAKRADGPSGDSEAAKQAARYLKLLKCPACDTNFKSHVILRCMHVFCKSCMDKQMEYRQRKCPTCRESFGAKDVKEIYL